MEKTARPSQQPTLLPHHPSPRFQVQPQQTDLAAGLSWSHGYGQQNASACCHECQRTFVSEVALQMHLQNAIAHRPRNRAPKPSARVSFDSGPVHPVTNKFSCICKHQFITGKALQMHTSESKSGIHFPLPQAALASTPKAPIQSPFLNVEPPGIFVPVQLHCGICQQIFVTEAGFHTHLCNSQASSNARAEPKEAIARLEGEIAMHAAAMKAAAAGKSNAAVAEKPVSIRCDVCERDFSTDTGLQLHVATSKVHKKEFRRQSVSVSVRKNVELAKALISTVPDVNASATSINSKVQGQRIEPILGENYSLNVPLNSQSSHWGVFQQESNKWSAVPASEWAVVLKTLASRCHTRDDLLRQNYHLSVPTMEELGDMRKCRNCGVMQKKLLQWDQLECRFHKGKQAKLASPWGEKPYACCGKSDIGCTTLPTHSYKALDSRLSSKLFIASSPPARPQVLKRAAVTLDCEMVSVGFGAGVGEVALICLADYLTGETLVNAFVNPKQIVSDWRTRYSGITAAAMKAAIDNGEALDGWEGAREAVWKHIDAETILVGHALQHDLEVLRMIHTRIVDSGILARNAVSPPSGRQWGLKGLCAQLLHLDVQNHGKKGHDCLEDVLATRELVLWCTREAARFNAWGAAVGKEEQRLKMAQAAQRAQKLAEQANAVNPPAKGQQSEGFEKQAAGLSSSDVESWL